MKKKYVSGDIESSASSRTEYLLWKYWASQIGCMPSDGTIVHLFSVAQLTAKDLVHIAAIMQEMSADFTKKRKRKGDSK